MPSPCPSFEGFLGLPVLLLHLADQIEEVIEGLLDAVVTELVDDLPLGHQEHNGKESNFR